MMDAPIYPAAVGYRQPTVVPRPITTRDTSIADMVANPAVRAIAEAEIPGLKQRIGAGPLVPHLGNFSMRALVQFGVFQAAQLDRLDERLRAAGLMQETLR